MRVSELIIDQYPILNEAATMWYHPHGQSGLQVYRGLAGLFIIDDANSKSLDLPNTYGVDDIPLVIQERLFDGEGLLHYEPNTVPFMYHCHILEHEDGSMMGQFVVVEPDSQ